MVGVPGTESHEVRGYDHFVHFLLKSALVGLVAGAVTVGFRLSLTGAEAWRHWVLGWRGVLPAFWGWLALAIGAAVVAAVAGWLTDRAPETAGGGITHVEAVLGAEKDLRWRRVLPVKFLAGALTLSTGLSLGPEGPAVQLGSAAAQAVSRGLRRPKAEEYHLIACGAGAGLAAAFNAPLAGVLFVVEELRRNFSPYALGGALAACVTADLVSLAVVGPLPAFRVAYLQPLPLTTLPLFLLLGLTTGAAGALFNAGLLRTAQLSQRLAQFPRWLRAGLITLAVGLLGYSLPQVLGSGHNLVLGLLSTPGRFTLSAVLLLLAVKFLLVMVSYAAGLPGGILLPLLSLGALSGSLVSQTAGALLPGPDPAVQSLVIVGMAAFFVAVVRSPLTGIVLITEMTGRYQHMLPLLLSCIVAYVTAEALGSPPVYEGLLELGRGLDRPGVPRLNQRGTGEIQIAVESGAAACGCQVKDLPLPEDSLLVSVQRGSREIIPRGNTRLCEGDVLRLIAPVGRLASVRQAVAGLVCCRFARRP